MPIKKDTKKKEQDPYDKILDTVKDKLEDLEGLVKHAKEKFDKTDDKTKKQILAGAVGAATILAGALGIKQAIKGGRKKDK